MGFVARHRGWRVPELVAKAVCAHAAAAWWVAGLGLGLGVAISKDIAALASPLIQLTPFGWVLPVIGPLAGFSLGMLAFETLVYIGVRRCKFMNW